MQPDKPDIDGYAHVHDGGAGGHCCLGCDDIHDGGAHHNHNRCHDDHHGSDYCGSDDNHNHNRCHDDHHGSDYCGSDDNHNHNRCHDDHHGSDYRGSNHHRDRDDHDGYRAGCVQVC